MSDGLAGTGRKGKGGGGGPPGESVPSYPSPWLQDPVISRNLSESQIFDCRGRTVFHLAQLLKGLNASREVRLTWVQTLTLQFPYSPDQTGD